MYDRETEISTHMLHDILQTNRDNNVIFVELADVYQKQLLLLC